MLRLSAMSSDFELKPMTVARLKVARQNDFGAFLDAGTGNSDDDILLHKLQQTAPVKIGDTVEVFLYLDPKKRLTASMRVPKMKIGQIARLKVLNVTNDGAFLDVGAERGIFMPFAEMFGRLKVGDVVWARLYLDKRTGRLAVSMKVSKEIWRAFVPAEKIQRDAKITGAVFEITEAGAFIFTNERHIILVKKIPRGLEIGETVEVRVKNLLGDGTIEATIFTDADKILEHIRENGGVTSFNDKSEPEEIFDAFKMSKRAFKQAIGHLLRDRLIEKIDGGFKAVG